MDLYGLPSTFGVCITSETLLCGEQETNQSVGKKRQCSPFSEKSMYAGDVDEKYHSKIPLSFSFQIRHSKLK